MRTGAADQRYKLIRGLVSEIVKIKGGSAYGAVRFALSRFEMERSTSRSGVIRRDTALNLLTTVSGYGTMVVMNKPFKHPLKVGDRVTMPSVDEVPGTVIEIGYNLYTKVKYDDGQEGMTTADLLKKASA